LAFGLLVCATAATAQEIRDTSFLKDESQLQPGRGNQARLVYINPETDFSRYDKAVVDRVALWFRDEKADGGVEAFSHIKRGQLAAFRRPRMYVQRCCD